MTDEIVRRAHSVFVAALDVDEPDRASFIEAACLDNESLHARVVRLLDAVEQTGGFLEGPVRVLPATSRAFSASSAGSEGSATVASASAALASSAADPATVDPATVDPATADRATADRAAAADGSFQVPGYTIEGVIGSGGMATVHAARQHAPPRTVAMKVMHRHLEATAARQRFIFEAEILAALRHPGIAQVFEAGTIDAPGGRTIPYFTMELVPDASPITEFAAARDLSRRQRLELFGEVCAAVRHGHEAGFIHRDLKPSNVLVGADGRVRVIDFGIARSIAADDDRLTLEHERERLMGTLNYMSPEQCAGSAHVDTRSDVYALGVMLHQLVLGRLPHDLTTVPLPEAVRRKGLPPRRPSADDRRVRGDLECLMLTALDPDRERRYATAAALEADLRRFLAGQPVHARPQTAASLLHAFARRHRPLVAAAAFVLVALLGSVVATGRAAIVAGRAREAEAARAADLDRVSAFQRSQLTDIDVAATGARLRETLAAAVAGEGGDPAVLDGVNFTSLALVTLDEAILARARTAIDEQFAEQPRLAASLLMTLAETARTLGLPDRARDALEAAVAIRTTELGPDHPETLIARHAMGDQLATLGRYAESRAVLEQVLEQRTRLLGPDDPATLHTAGAYAGVLRRAGDLPAAEELWEDTLARSRRVRGDDHPDTLQLLHNFGVVRAFRGDLAGAEVAWREVIERRQRVFGSDSPDLRGPLFNLALVLAERGGTEEARMLMAEGLELRRRIQGDDHPDTLDAMASLAQLHHAAGDHAAAEERFDECLAGRRRVLGAEHPATLAVEADRALLIAERGPGRVREAVAILRSVLERQSGTIGPDHPRSLATGYQLAQALLLAGHPDEAAATAEARLEAARAAGRPIDGIQVGGVLTLAQALAELGRHAERSAVLRAALEAVDAPGAAVDPDHHFVERLREASAGLD